MIVLSKKVNLILAIIALTMAIGLFVGAFCIAYFYEFEAHTNKTFTCEKTVKENGRTIRYNLYTAEEDKPLTISVNANKYLDKDAFLNLKQGDAINCEVVKGDDEYSYEIVELVYNDRVLLSLDKVEKAYKNNSVIGAVFTSFIGVIVAAMSGILFRRVKYGYSERYKNAEKKNVKKFLLQYAKSNDMDLQETQRIIDIIDGIDMSDKLPCEKDELINSFKNCFQVRENRTYTTASEYLENQGCHKVFREALKTILKDGELRICYDAGLTDNSALYLLYNTNGKIIDGYILRNDDTGKFPIDKLDLSGDLYNKVTLTKIERAELIEKLREYNRLYEDIFDIDRNLM